MIEEESTRYSEQDLHRPHETSESSQKRFPTASQAVVAYLQVPYDIRRADPHLVYDELDFEIPIGEVGDSYDRFLVGWKRCAKYINHRTS